jgi:hypothetical protein
VKKTQVYFWLSTAVLAIGPLALAFSPLGFFEGPR